MKTSYCDWVQWKNEIAVINSSKARVSWCILEWNYRIGQYKRKMHSVAHSSTVVKLLVLWNKKKTTLLYMCAFAIFPPNEIQSWIQIQYTLLMHFLCNVYNWFDVNNVMTLSCFFCASQMEWMNFQVENVDWTFVINVRERRVRYWWNMDSKNKQIQQFRGTCKRF